MTRKWVAIKSNRQRRMHGPAIERRGGEWCILSTRVAACVSLCYRLLVSDSPDATARRTLVSTQIARSVNGKDAPCTVRHCIHQLRHSNEVSIRWARLAWPARQSSRLVPPCFGRPSRPLCGACRVPVCTPSRGFSGVRRARPSWRITEASIARRGKVRLFSLFSSLSASHDSGGRASPSVAYQLTEKRHACASSLARAAAVLSAAEDSRVETRGATCSRRRTVLLARQNGRQVRCESS